MILEIDEDDSTKFPSTIESNVAANKSLQSSNPMLSIKALTNIADFQTMRVTDYMTINCSTYYFLVVPHVNFLDLEVAKSMGH